MHLFFWSWGVRVWNTACGKYNQLSSHDIWNGSLSVHLKIPGKWWRLRIAGASKARLSVKLEEVSDVSMRISLEVALQRQDHGLWRAMGRRWACLVISYNNRNYCCLLTVEYYLILLALGTLICKMYKVLGPCSWSCEEEMGSVDEASPCTWQAHLPAGCSQSIHISNYQNYWESADWWGDIPAASLPQIYVDIFQMPHWSLPVLSHLPLSLHLSSSCGQKFCDDQMDGSETQFKMGRV